MLIRALAEAARRFTDAQIGTAPFATAVPGLIIHRADHAMRPAYRVFKPALCVVAQGSKWAVVGDRRLEYRAGQALLASVEVPGVGRIVEASPDRPYLGVIIEFDPAIMREVLESLTRPPGSDDDAPAGVFVADIDGPLADCVLRMVRLLDAPAAIPVLRPLILRELSYWLLTGPHGGAVARMVLTNTHAADVIRAVHVLRDRFTEPIRVAELARVAGLSPSAFHRRFKAVTALTPLQYQKQLRLLEARRLLVAEAASVESAAARVGYESASQFSREYARLFGAPPRRDAVAVRSLASSRAESRNADRPDVPS
ncbi:AraC family transcriptional regulator [Frigoriglobus tundricola]|uniref:Transcriptional regulator, AraC family n=1 Tax=Frigoriglobus tundricola TaxID=2774151 RepID=A0A6M5YW89_9BACT|nr:AraC family transcriptional regulator [Frigoriglobus tundricola]QJW98295.1 Transcriptional regulator, AraC family [Frigoriglobus tundricola]